MGSKYEVHVWVKGADGEYFYQLVYSGDSYDEMTHAWKQGKEISGCVKITDRT